MGVALQTSATGGLTASLATLASMTGAKVAAGLRGIVNMVGGPYVATFMAAAYATYELYNAQNAAGEAIASSTSFLEDSKKTVEEATNKIYLHTSATKAMTLAGMDLNDCTYHGTDLMDAYKIHMDKVTGGLYSQAEAARAATIETLKLQAAQNQGQLATLQTHSTKELGALASRQQAQGHYGESFLTSMYQGAQGVSSLLPFGTSQRDTDAQIARVRSNGSTIDQQLKEAQSKSTMDIVKDMQARGLGAPDKTDSHYEGTEAGDKKKRHRKVKDAEDLAKAIENTVDTLMKKLDAENPMGKLYDDYVKTITAEGHVLLSNSGYMKWQAQIKAGSKSAANETELLMAALSDTDNLDKKTMADLEKRYNTNAAGVRKLLAAQLAAYEIAKKQAVLKDSDYRHADSKEMISAIGSAVPEVEALSKALSEVGPMAQAALSSDDYSKWLEDLRSGVNDARGATQDLSDRIMELAGHTPSLDRALKESGMSARQYADAVEAAGRAIDYKTRMDKRDIGYGATTLRGMDQDNNKLNLTDRDASVMEKLTQATKDYLAAGSKEGPLTMEKVKGLEMEIRARQNLADQLQRNKSFFENNGVRGYINDIKDVGSAVNDLDKNVLQSLEDQLYNLGTTGKFSFNEIFKTIQGGLVRFASQGIMKTLTSKLFGDGELDGGAPSIFGKLFGQMGFKYQPDQKGKLGQTMGLSETTAMWVRLTGVNPMTGETWSGKPDFGSVGVVDPTTGKSFGEMGGAIPFGANTDLSNITGGLSKFGGGGGSSSTSTAAALNPAAIAPVVTPAAKATAQSFQQQLSGYMPLIGMAFAGTFKSPIAQVGAMFASMLLQKMLAGGGGGGGGGGMGGLGGLLGSLFGGGGGATPGFGSLDEAMAAAGGGFKEGGYSNAPVTYHSIHPAMFRNAPHYREGTANTSGGIPAILHDNEAVIPLSRGRKIPVEMAGSSRGQTIVQNYNIQTPDANSFRQSKQQLATDMHMMAGRAYRRNHG
jgi:hypothetical protein